MYLTERGAKKKFCPIKWRNIITDGKQLLPANAANCSASDCMMWRWCVEPGNEDLDGYCGLAGG